MRVNAATVEQEGRTDAGLRAPASTGILDLRKRKLQSARELAKKAPLIRKRLEEEAALLKKREAEPEQRIEQAPETSGSREADAVLKAVVGEVCAARSADRATEESLRPDDRDYVAALERRIAEEVKAKI